MFGFCRMALPFFGISGSNLCLQMEQGVGEPLPTILLPLCILSGSVTPPFAEGSLKADTGCFGPRYVLSRIK